MSGICPTSSPPHRRKIDLSSKVISEDVLNTFVQERPKSAVNQNRVRIMQETVQTNIRPKSATSVVVSAIQKAIDLAKKMESKNVANNTIKRSPNRMISPGNINKPYAPITPVENPDFTYRKDSSKKEKIAMKRIIDDYEWKNLPKSTSPASNRTRIELDASNRRGFMDISPITFKDFEAVECYQNKGNDCEETTEFFKTLRFDFLEIFDCLIRIEYCCNCSNHNNSLRHLKHNEMKYKNTCFELCKYLLERIVKSRLNLRVGVQFVPISQNIRVGAFEVSRHT